MQATRRRYCRTGFRTLCGAFALFVLCARPAAGQVAVIPGQPLRFGTLLPGVPTRVAPTDGTARADIQVTGKGRMTFVVVLPASVTNISGQTIPLQFSANDGLYQVGKGPLNTFDPRSPLTITVPASGGAVTLYVGGTAVPSSIQPPGSYSALLTVQAIR